MRALFDGLGTVYALINNVGIAGPTAAIDALDIADVRDTFNVNVASHVIATQQVVPAMIAAGEGVIINLSSVAGRIGLVNRLAYVASKWAVRGVTRELANELGRHNIRVNAIMPGAVGGDRIRRVVAARADIEGISEDAALGKFLGGQAMGRLIDPADLAEMIVFLLSDAAKTISGAEFENAGGHV